MSYYRNSGKNYSRNYNKASYHQNSSQNYQRNTQRNYQRNTQRNNQWDNKDNQFPPPEPITCTINSQQVFNFVSNLFNNADYASIYKLVCAFRNVARSIMGRNCSEQFVIDAEIIHLLEQTEITNTLPKFLVSFDQTVARSNTAKIEQKELNALTWTNIYRAMFPRIIGDTNLTNSNQLPSTPLVPLSYFNLSNFFTYLTIFMNFQLSEVSKQRLNIVKEYQEKIEDAISRLDPNDTNYNYNVKQIKSNLNTEQFKKEKETKEDAWKFPDSCREYLGLENPSKRTMENTDINDVRINNLLQNLNDIKIRMIWTVLTLNPLICGVNPIYADIIGDGKMLFIDFVNDPEFADISVYWKTFKALNDRFYSRFKQIHNVEYTNDLCDKETFDEWKDVHIYQNIILLVVQFKLSSQSTLDVINYDTLLIKLLQTYAIPYEPYVYNPTFEHNVYNELELEHKDRPILLQSILNRLSKRYFDIYANLILSLYSDNVNAAVPKIVNYAIGSVVSKECVGLIKHLAEGANEQVNVKQVVNEVKVKRLNYWKLYCDLFMNGLIDNGVSFINEVINALNINNMTNAEIYKNIDFVLECLEGFEFNIKSNTELFVKDKNTFIQLCRDVINKEYPSKLSMRIQFRIEDIIEHVEKNY